jgi:hypothetical protein
LEDKLQLQPASIAAQNTEHNNKVLPFPIKPKPLDTGVRHYDDIEKGNPVIAAVRRNPAASKISSSYNQPR